MRSSTARELRPTEKGSNYGSVQEQGQRHLVCAVPLHRLEGERQQKLKRGFATKRDALAWEREFLMEKQADVNMTFESFVALYEKDVKPKL